MINDTKIDRIRTLFGLIDKDPKLGERKLGQLSELGHSTVGKYRRLVTAHGLTAEQIMQLSDEQLAVIFNIGSKKQNFLEPDWEEIRDYLQKKNAWGSVLPTTHSAWEKLYLKRLFPLYTVGKLPDLCMSERTFTRRYAEYLDSIGLSGYTHNPNPNNNFGPGSMVEIDTVGDKFKFIDAAGNSRQCVIFSAVLKYSGYIYAEAMPSSKSLCWAGAIVNAMYYFTGCPQVVRCDNDTAICHHDKPKNGVRLRASIEYVLRAFQLGSDLCPVMAPEWKGTNENSNGFLLRHLFEYEHPKQSLRFDDLADLNRKIRLELVRINSLPRNHGQLSRMAIFERYEKNALLPLPMFRPSVHSLSYGHVNQNGYVLYLKNYYFAGHANRDRDIVILNDQGKHIYLKQDDKNLTPIADYALDHNVISPKYHKAEQFKTEKEIITSRTKDWFIAEFSKIGGYPEIIQTIEWLFEVFSSSKQVATRLSNQIYALYQEAPENLDCLNVACADVLKKKNKTNLKGQIYSNYTIFSKVKALGTDIFAQTVGHQLHEEAPESTSLQQSKQQNGEKDSVRGEEYYDALCK